MCIFCSNRKVNCIFWRARKKEQEGNWLEFSILLWGSILLLIDGENLQKENYIIQSENNSQMVLFNVDFKANRMADEKIDSKIMNIFA